METRLTLRPGMHSGIWFYIRVYLCIYWYMVLALFGRRSLLVRRHDARIPMSELQYFKTMGDYAEYRPTGHVSQSQMVQLVASALAFAREQHIGKLLVVTSGLTGFRPPL